MKRTLSLWVLGGTVAAALWITSGTRIGARGGQQIDGITPEGLAQIQALLEAKEARTPAEKKLDSQLLYAMRMQQGVPIAPGVPTQEVDLPRGDDGHVIVDVRANGTPSLLAHVNAITSEAKAFPGGMLQMHVTLDQIGDLASDPDVIFVQPKQEFMTARRELPGRMKQAVPHTQEKSVRPSSWLLRPPPRDGGPLIGSGSGSITAQADITHRAAVFRGLTGATGLGIKIGVLSDGVSNLAVSQSTGDLGPVTVLPGQAGSGDEGTAMLELIHDLAPDAQLYFATAGPTITQFAANIQALNAAGCSIIVDDVFYYVETPFQDGQLTSTNTNGGIVISAVQNVTGLYFSSAGNSGNLNDGTSGVWEGDFVDGGATAAPLPAGNVHNFAVSQSYDSITVPGNRINLYWSDPLGGSTNDYDLFRLNSAGSAVLSSSTNVQSSTQDPYEEFGAHSVGDRLAIVRKAGAAGRYLHLNTNRGRLSVATSGQTHGHAATTPPHAFGVAAASAIAIFPNPFSTSNAVETFSSDGLRRLFYTNAGAAYTPGNVSSTGGIVIQKPDITAADGVYVNGSGGFSSPFFGTSAAAPNAAAIAALIKSANPGYTTNQVRLALAASALDIEAPGVDRDSGVGIVMAAAPQPACTMTVTGAASYGAGPASGTATVAASTGSCNWVVWSDVNWITFPNPVGIGGAGVSYNVAANPGPVRSGRIFVQGGSTVVITQAASASAPLTFTATGPVTIADNATATLSLPVAGLTAPIGDVTVSLYITHTFDDDLTISLVAPDSTVIPLATGRGGSGDNFGSSCSSPGLQTVFDDAAAKHVVEGVAPFAGVYRAEGALTKLRGKSGAAVNGTWTLRVKDSFTGDTGAIQCWSLNVWSGANQVSDDFDGDTRADIALYKSNGDWSILKSSSNYMAAIIKNWGGGGYTAVPGDYDGDTIQDLGLYRESTGDWLVLKSSTNFTTGLSVSWGGPGYKPVPGDYDGDGRTDPAVYNAATGQWTALRSSASYMTVLGVSWGGPGYTPVPGQDFDGDAKADVAIYQNATGLWLVLTSSSGYAALVSAGWGGPGYVLVPGDYDGDFKADLGLYEQSSGYWYVLLSNTGYTTSLIKSWGGAGYLPVPGDFDGDRRTDLGIFQTSTGNWSALKSLTNYTTAIYVPGWGAGGDRPVSSAIFLGDETTRATDWDGDAHADITVYNSTTGAWSILKSTGSYATGLGVSLGGFGYQPVPGDYDGDGRTDAAVYHAASTNWSVLFSSTSFTTGVTKSDGGTGWAPVQADYDGDGKTDIATYNTSTGVWFVLKSSTGFATAMSVSWGGSGYIAQPADFDGDAKADLALYQSSTGNWIVLLSSTSYTTSIFKNVGGSGYLPVAADYDGDRKADFAVYHSASGLWYGLKSSTGYAAAFAISWGGTGYIAIRGDYDGDGRTDLALYHGASGNWYVLLSTSGYTAVLGKSLGGAGYTAVPNYLYP